MRKRWLNRLTPSLAVCLLSAVGCQIPAKLSPSIATSHPKVQPRAAADSRRKSESAAAGVPLPQFGPDTGSRFETASAKLGERDRGEGVARSRDAGGALHPLSSDKSQPGTKAPEVIQRASHEAPADPPQPAGAPNQVELNLATVLTIVDGQNPQVQLARERIVEAYAQQDRAEYLWLPSLRAGANYNRHEGAIQDVAGRVFNTSRGSAYGGWGASAVGAGSPAVPGLYASFHVADALFQPRIAALETDARSQAAQAARNDFLRDAAVAYWEVVRADQQRAVATEALQNAEDLEKLTRSYADTGQGLKADHQRAAAEVAVRQGELLRTDEAVRVNSAELARLLQADPSVVIHTGTAAAVPLDLTPPETAAADLVGVGLSHRPELCESRQLVVQACERLRREKFAPLVPSVLLGASYGAFGGGKGTDVKNTDQRFDADVVAYWEVRNLGVGERAARDEAASRFRQAQLREMALLDRVARDVVSAHAQVQSRFARIGVARDGLRAAEQSYSLNRDRIQNAQGLPIEVLQSLQSLATARREYVNAIVDYNVAQFQLWWALGWHCEPFPQGG